MEEIIIAVVPVIAILGFGLLLRAIGLFGKSEGHLLIQIVFYTAVPALIFNTFRDVELNFEFIYISVAAFVMLAAFFVVALVLGKYILKLPRKKLGTFVVGMMIINTGGITFAYVLNGLGEEAVPRYEMFNRVHSLVTFTFTYFLASYFGDHETKLSKIVYKVFVSPPLWATTAGIAFNVLNIELHEAISRPIDYLAAVTVPMSLLAISFLLHIKAYDLRLTLTAVITRLVLGITLALLLANIFELDSFSRTILVAISAGPIGTNTLNFAAVEKLDEELAASMISLSLLFTLVITPFILVFA